MRRGLFARKASELAGTVSQLGDFTTDRRVLELAAMAVIVGAAGAGSAWVLMKLIALVTNLVWFGRLSAGSFNLSQAKPSLWMVLAPALGGLVIGFMARFGSEKIRGHGIPEAIEAILIGGSRMEPRVAALKPLSSAIAIGTGGPFGAEGPIIMTGGALASLFAQFFNLTAAERKTLLVAGAAAGMTAVFGTPMAAIMLSVELLLFELKPRSLIPVIISCVVAEALRPYLIGKGALFPMHDTPLLPWWGLFACLGVGIVAGLQSGAMTGLLYKAEEGFERLPIHWMWWPAIGGVVVGLGGLIEPRALGVGYDVIRDLLSGAMTGHEVTAILLVKSGIWIIALASGTSGGVLAPLLIMGGALGWLEGQWLPGGAPFWSLVGMASMMGGTMRAPLTGVLFALELTDNIHVLLPLLLAAGAAYALTVLLLKRSILTEKIARRGQHVTREYSTDPFELLRVGEMMVKDVDVLPASMSIADALAFFREDVYRHKSYPVVDEDGQVVGMAGRSDVMRWRTAIDHSATLYESISDRSLLVGYPDEVLARVADRMVEADLGRIPIVDRATRRLVGLIARKDLMRTRLVTNQAEQERAAFFGYRAKTSPQIEHAKECKE